MIEKFLNIKENIKKVYKSYNRPFIIAFSGGKDSSMVLQLFWLAISELSISERRNKIFVITSDTMVENPYMFNYLKNTMSNIASNAKLSNMPISTHIVKPDIDNTFFVNLIGKGYAAPSQMFRWCTQRIKTTPISNYIKSQVDEYGESIIVIGARMNESISRDKVLKSKVRNNLGLSAHNELPGSLIFTPIEDMKTDEVWEFLLEYYKTPYGLNNNDLFKLYEGASADNECSLITDSKSTTCGGSRFGCWTCTLVKEDKSMSNVIKHGDHWLQPLLDYRNFLSKTQIPEDKHIYRSHRKDNGKILLVRDGTRISYGPYKFKWKVKLLEMLLETQLKIQKNGPDPTYELITYDEIIEIQKQWKVRNYDNRTAIDLYNHMMGVDSIDNDDDGVVITSEDEMFLRNMCDDNNVEFELIRRLLTLEKSEIGKVRRYQIMDKLDKILSSDWRSEAEVLDNIVK